MRDVVAALVAIGLLVVAASLATTLHFWRRRRLRAHDSERALGRTIVAEIPTDDDLKLFSEDTVRFHYGDRSIDKDLVTAARVLINGSPIAAVVSTRHVRDGRTAPDVIRRSAGRHRTRSVGRRHRNRDGNRARRMRRDSRAHLPGARESRLRSGRSGTSNGETCRLDTTITREPRPRRHSGSASSAGLRGIVQLGRIYHSVSATPARRFTARASTNSRSDRRLM